MTSAKRLRAVAEQVLHQAVKQRALRGDPPLLSEEEISRALADGMAAMRAALDDFTPPAAPRGRFR